MDNEDLFEEFELETDKDSPNIQNFLNKKTFRNPQNPTETPNQKKNKN